MGSGGWQQPQRLSSRHFSYVWEHLDVGYVQGMCDLLAPLLVVLDDGEGLGWE